MLLGLHGRAGSGKDQSYKYIEDWGRVNHVPTRRDAFADRMKLSAARALGYQGTDEECLMIMTRLRQPGWEVVIVEPGGNVEHPITGREFLQFYGTEAHRGLFGVNVWIDLLMADYNGLAPGLVVVTDVRFANEAAAIHRAGGEIWHIDGPHYPLIPESGHSSEATLPMEMIDHHLENDRGLDHLEQLVHTETRRLMAGYLSATLLH